MTVDNLRKYEVVRQARKVTHAADSAFSFVMPLLLFAEITLVVQDFYRNTGIRSCWVEMALLPFVCKWSFDLFLTIYRKRKES